MAIRTIINVLKIGKVDKIGESIKTYFQTFLRITLSNIIVHALSMPHFKGFGMRNLHHYIRICQKMYNKGTMTENVYYLFRCKGKMPGVPFHIHNTTD